MPKEITVDPAVTRRRDEIVFSPIPVHAYDTPIAAERKRLGDAKLIGMLRHMLIVREFETMLGEFKARGAYSGIAFNYKGPAHLSVGHEGAAVGAAMALTPNDHIFGSHRSHGEFIAKGLAAIDRLDERQLMNIMEVARDGRVLSAVQRFIKPSSEQALAESFMLFGLLSEIFMRATGFNGGMGGSMHAFFLPFGAYPNNAIVGASAGIATGAALRKKLAQEGGIAVAFAGDGATGCGPVYEAMNFGAMAQYDRLWPEPYKGGLPVLYFFTNNFYAMGGQTSGETMGWDRLSRIGAGTSPTNLHAETVDGANPLAVLDAVSRKRALLVEGKGPALLDVETYRISGHSTTDANSYRTREEIQAWSPYDPIAVHGAALREAGILDEAGEEALRGEIREMIRAVTAAAVDPEAAPIVDIAARPTLIGELMFSNGSHDLGEPDPAIAKAAESSSQLRQLGKKSRTALGPDGAKLSPMRAITIRDALFEAVLHHFTHDPALVAYGEECREWGGAFGVYRGLSDILPYNRLFNAPISEAAIVATAIGYAIEGGRALVELMYTDFIGRAGDEIFNQLAKWQSMSAGALRLPVVLRSSIGSKYGAQHSQDWTGLVAHIPGLKVVYPATPFDAKGLLASSLASRGPGGVLREPAALRHHRAVQARRRADRLLSRPDRRAGREARGRRRHHPHRRSLALRRDRGGGRAGEGAGHLLRDHRRPFAGAVRLRARAGLGEEDRPYPAGLGGERARLLPPDPGRQYQPLRLRRAQGAAARPRLAQLDRAGRRDGVDLLPAGGRHRRRGPRGTARRIRLQSPRRAQLGRP